MAKPKELAVQSLKEFSEIIEDCLHNCRVRNPNAKFVGNWYRGLGAAASHKLLPALYRHPKKTEIKDLLELEASMLSEFNRQSVLHEMRQPYMEKSQNFEMLFYMQHYGVPTRLLDWSLNPFIGLYFSLTAAQREVGSDVLLDDVALWILDPIAWNRRALKELSWDDRGPSLPDDPDIGTYHPKKGEVKPGELKNMYDFPVAIYGVANSTRMFAQKGVFTVFGKEVKPMEQIYDEKDFPVDCLVKVVVKKDKIDETLSKLIAIGYTDSVSYPDLHGLALELKRLNGFRM